MGYGGPPAPNAYPSKDLIHGAAATKSWDDKEADLARKASEFVAGNEAKLFVAANEAKIAQVSRTEKEKLDGGRQMKEGRMKKYRKLSSEHIEKNYKSPERFRSRSQDKLRSKSPKYGKFSRSPDWEELNRRSPVGRRPSSPHRRGGQFSRSPERIRSRNSSRQGEHGSGSSSWKEDRLTSRR